jgi:hypothetical protein
VTSLPVDCKMLDVRALARTLGISQVELVRELGDDGVPLVPISAKRWRVAEADYLQWLDRRKAKAAEAAAQRRLRMRHVAGKPAGAPSGERVRFKR